MFFEFIIPSFNYYLNYMYVYLSFLTTVMNQNIDINYHQDLITKKNHQNKLFHK